MRLKESYFKLFLTTGFLFTCAFFTWLILTPSLSSNLFFLNFSIQRFLLIAITGIVLFTLLIGYVCSKNRLLNYYFNKLMSSKVAFLLFFITTQIVVFIIIGVLFRVYGARTSFFERILTIILLYFQFSVGLFVWSPVSYLISPLLKFS